MKTSDKSIHVGRLCVKMVEAAAVRLTAHFNKPYTREDAARLLITSGWENIESIIDE